MMIGNSPGDFVYIFVTVHIATIFAWGSFHQMEADYEGWEEAELNFPDWIPVLNLVILIIFYMSFLYDVHILKHRMVRKAKKILEEDAKGEEEYN